MFRRMSFILVTISMIAVLIVTSWVIGLTSADTVSEPVEVSQVGTVGVTAEETNVSVAGPELRITNRRAVPVPEDKAAEAERLRAYLLWKHNATPIEAHEIAASERWLDYLHWKHPQSAADIMRWLASERWLDYLRWKQQVEGRPHQDAAESERLLDYLRWKHNDLSGLDNEGGVSGSAAPQSSVETENCTIVGAGRKGAA